MHKLLKRQLDQCNATSGPPDGTGWSTLLAKVSEAYDQADADRHLLERALDLTSKELMARYLALREDMVRVQRMEAQLRRERDASRMIVDGAGVLILGVDPGGRVTVFNKAAQRLTGRAEDTVVGVGWVDDILRTDDQGALREAIAAAAAAATGTRQERSEPRAILAPLSTASGETRTIAWRASGIVDGDDMTTVLLFGSDETERLRLEREAQMQRESMQRSERLNALGTLVAGVAHEINNPLTYIRGNLELALMDAESLAPLVADAKGEAVPDLDALKKGLVSALGGAERIARIARALKAVGRPDVGRRDRLDLGGLITGVEDLLRVGLPPGVDLFVELPSETVAVVGNASELYQAVLNLATNSIDALASKGGQVRLAIEATPDTVDLLVTDDGPGIPEDIIPRIFTPFFTTKSDGTGLGLSIAHTIIEEHGGKILVRTEVGRGTTMVVRLPRVGAQATAETASTVGTPTR